ncbi:MAG: class I SAM-dependent methyltransferase [Flavobacteriales bacterium]
MGRTLPWLAERFGQVHAVDISRKCLAIAQRKGTAYTNITYAHADLSKDTGLPGPVDLVVSINTLLNASLGKREAIMEHTCSAVRKGGHLLLVVPSVESALLTSHKLVQWHRRSGMAPNVAERKAWRDGSRLDLGVVMIDDVPTKHHLREELEELVTLQGLQVQEVLKIEYPWSTEFEEPARWMRGPYPWDWLMVAEQRK